MLKILKTFYSFVLHKRKGTFIFFILLVIISSILFSLNPVFYRLFVDNIPSLNESRLLQILLYYMLIRILAVIFDMTSFWIGDILLFNSEAESRIVIFKKVQDLDFAFHSEKSTGSLGTYTFIYRKINWT